MRKWLLIGLFIFPGLRMQAQKYDNMWELSYGDITVPNSEVNFINGQPDTNRLYRYMILGNTDVTMCDTAGNLLFYTNGQEIANRKHKYLYNSRRFNPGYGSDTFYASYDIFTDSVTYQGLLLGQSCLALPFADSTNKYYLFSCSFDWFHGHEWAGQSFDPLNLRYSVIDMNMDTGYGGIPIYQKSIVAISDTLLIGRITAVRHADGKRWWVIVHKQSSDLIYKILVSDTGICSKTSQHTGVHSYDKIEIPQFAGQPWKGDLFGESIFSPDGKQYAMTGSECKILLMDFNRCTGEFSNIRSFKTPIVDTALVVTLGCSFSPNSRYLYMNTYQRLYQYDTWNPNIDSIDAVEVLHYDYYDTSVIPYRLFMFFQLLAPDNKIYINTFGGSKFLTVVNSPDSAGFACQAVQNQLVIPQYNIAMPNFVNYKLKALNIYWQQKLCCDDTLVAGSTTALTIPHHGGITYSWYDEHGNLIGTDTSLNITADSTTTYYVVYTDSTPDTLSCQSFMDSVKIYVYKIPPPPFDTTCDIYLPTLLSTGQYLKNITITAPYKLRVFNILGELIYSSDDYKGEWQPPTTGFYILETACVSGEVRVRKLVVE